MRGRLQSWIVGLVAAMAVLAGGAMTGSEAATNSHCEVLGGDKLPSQTGVGAICLAVERAIAARAPNVPYNAKIRVVSASKLTATLIVNGRSLPEQNFAVMDRNLNPTAIEHFADSLAATVAGAASK